MRVLRERSAVSLVKIALLAATLLTGVATDAFADGSISGRVTSSTTGFGLPNTGVVIFNIADDFAVFVTTDATGNYTANLPADTYVLFTQDTHGYINEIYNNIPCSAVCDTSTVAQIIVTNSPVVGIDFVLDPGGRITGKVTQADGTTPIAGVRVNFVDPNGQLYFTSGLTDAMGNYISDGGTGTGNVYAFTTNTLGYQEEAYNNVPCLGCVVEAVGTLIPVTLAGGATGIDFALDLGGIISGTVTAVGGAPLANVGVNFTDSTGNGVGEVLTDAMGNYTSGGLPAGSYYANTYNTPGLVDQLYNNLTCAGGNCNPTFAAGGAATLIPVTIGGNASGINFVLSPGGIVSGTVTNAVGGAAIQGVFVGIFTVSTTPGPTFGLTIFLGGDHTNSLGAYSVILPAGTYFASVTNDPAGFTNQIYHGLPCPSSPARCSAGTPIVVRTGETTGNVDFALVAGSGSISGTVTNASAGGALLNNAQVQVFSSAGTLLGSVQTDASGVYTFTGLAPGSYYVRTNGAAGFSLINQLYNGVVCVSCNVVTSGGTLVTVTAGGRAGPIDFALAAGGSISGTITNAATSATIQGVAAQLFSATGVSMGSYNSNASGVYGMRGLPAGTYYVRASVPAALNFVDELWNDLACFPCTVTTGSPVVVTGTATTTGINFALSPGGSISGTVTDAGAGGAPVSSMAVAVFDSTGVSVKGTTTDASGNYTVAGLPNGDYFVVTNPSAGGQNYVGQKYNGFPNNGLPTTGTPVAVTVGTPHTGVDFALLSGGSLSGTVTGGSSLPLAGVQIGVYSSAGRVQKTAPTDAAGSFTIAGLQAGSYYVVARVGAPTPFYVDELYDNLPCLGCAAPAFPNVTLPCMSPCAPTLTTGTPVAITNGTTRSGVDFALASGAGVIAGTVTDGLTGLGLLNVQVSVSNAAGVVVKSVTSAANTGAYAVRGLAPGTYYARTIVSPATPYYTDEAYGNVPCAPCTVTTTSPITVTANTTTSSIDFALSSGGSITGLVTDAATTNPLASVDVHLFNATGNLVKTTFSGSIGTFRLDGLPTGAYYARTGNNAGYLDEVYDNISCAPCVATSGTPVTVTANQTTANVSFSLSPGGIISGRVTTASAAPLAGVGITVYDGNHSIMGSAATSVDGTYAVNGLPTGVYYAKTSNTQGYLNRLYETVTCLACGLIGGTPISVTAGSTTANVNFTLGTDGAIAGTVTGPSGPLAGVEVQVYSGNGQFLEAVPTDVLGQYRTSAGLPPGTYFVRTSNTLGFSDELYDNRACVACNPMTGTPVVVTGAAATTGIDFSLGLAGRISGTITDGAGTPLELVTVVVLSAAGTVVTSGTTNASGLYTTASEIPSGSYFVRTRNSAGYIDQVYRARECLECNPTAATAVAVAAGQPTNGIDFTLRRGGRVTGIITAATGGAAIPDVSISIVSGAGAVVAVGTTNALGQYASGTGLPTGSYYARTSNTAGFVDEVFDNLACVSCSATLGTPIAVTAGSDASGVDFGLVSGGRIAGTILDAATSQPIAGAQVDVYTVTGVFATSTLTGSAGRYVTESGLGAGRYVLKASSQLGYVTEVYNNLDCAACSPLTGTPVDVVAGQTTEPVDFSLARGGRITGTVTDAASGQALRDIRVTIYNQNNNLVASARTDATGQFTSGFGLPTGSYFARTSNSQGYVDELYDGTICVGCTPNTGTAIGVAVGQITANIDFQLARGAQMTGSIIETGTNVPLAGITVQIFDANAKLVTTGVTDSSGQFRTDGGLPNGTYFARTTNEQGYIDKAFDNAVCLACDVTRAASAIGVTSPTVVPGVNFSLSPGGRIAGRITASADGAAIGQVRVAIHNAAGALVGASSSNADGRYISVGLPPGSYRLRTFNRVGFIDEAFDDQRCGTCPMTTAGVAVSVTIAATVNGKNFALDAGGWVSGWVIDAITKAPLAGVTVSFLQNDVFVGRSLPSDASGYYAISLPAGAYAARPDPFPGYIVELTPALRAAAVGNVTVEVGLETPAVEFPLAACTPPAITTSTLPSATAGQPYSQTISASGGTGSKTFSHSGGELPPGLSLDPSSGQIAGTPTTLGTANFTVGVTDANGCSTTQTYALFACGVTLGETSATFAAGAGTRNVSVAANSSDCGWSASASDSWVTITSASGTGSGTLAYAVTANPTTDARTATITVGSETYTVTQNGQPVQTQPDPPIGTFDTPATGATVTGSIAVTGWTLSKVGIDRVEIWRDLTTGETTPPVNAPGHPGDGKVFIARGTFVRGARPDVAATYPSYPNADRGGWGYLLLTQGLWNVGNGTFTLYAFAFDVDGQVSTLGTKTITANNTQSTRPFGALDHPAYGATVSGGFWNDGWALTPTPNATDPQSCTITDGNIYVGIDSQPLVAVHYGEPRTDIAGFFPGFSNSGSAGGAYYIDTTALGNGDHQIGWYVVDSCGRADGIGSRFFSVLNGVNITTEAAPRALGADVRAALVVGDAGPIQVRTDEVTRQSVPDAQGVHVVQIAQRSRIEVELPKVEGAAYRGGEIVNGAERALPLGSSLDAARGVFYWEPAPAFLGTYELVFAAGDGPPIRVRVVVEP